MFYSVGKDFYAVEKLKMRFSNRSDLFVTYTQRTDFDLKEVKWKL